MSIGAAATKAVRVQLAIGVREVIALPLDQQGQDLLMSAPSPVEDKPLRALHIRTALPIKA